MLILAGFEEANSAPSRPKLNTFSRFLERSTLHFEKSSNMAKIRQKMKKNYLNIVFGGIKDIHDLIRGYV